MLETAASSLNVRLANLRGRLMELGPEEVVEFFGRPEFERLWKSTMSLCPVCLGHVPALVFERGGRVLMRKVCEAHGVTEALVENDARFYAVSNRDRWGRRYAELKEVAFPTFEGGGCGGEGGAENFADQWGNKSCTILAEVTDACNLACAVCYSDARGNRKLPLADFKKYIEALIARKGVLDSVQLTGGEALLHPEFWEMVEFLGENAAVKKIYLPTNGIGFADIDVAQRLQRFAAKTMVLLQFDGERAEGNRALRNANTSSVREKVIANLGELGIHMQLTMTITLGVNDGEIGWVIGQGMRHDHVKVVALQPVTYSGRYDLAQDAMKRMTLSDVVKAAAAQIGRETDYKPIPCSHPNCGWITLYARRFGMRLNIARHIDVERVMGQVANKTLLNTGELRSAIGSAEASPIRRLGEWVGKQLVRSHDVFAVAIKPFMDRFNYDQDRISNCCHHLLDTRGEPISFCEYNARLRPGDSWERFPKVKEG